MTEWRWVTAQALFAIHDRLIADHGGPAGLRDRGAIESALARPRNLASYGEAEAPALAAAYAYGLLRNHGFADGNKRAAWVAARLFLADNGYLLKHDPIEAVLVVARTAAGQLTEADLADWLRQRATLK